MGTVKFTVACTEEVSNKINVKYFIEKIKGIDLSLYTTTIKDMLFVFQAFPKNDPIHKGEEFKKMRRKTKTLELYLILDYEKIMKGTDPENLNHINEVFLKGCETFLKPLKGFEWEAFYEQLSEL